MKYLFLVPLAVTLLPGCSLMRNPNDPARNKQYVVVVNSISWTNPLSGQPDGTRTTWPLTQLVSHEELFPLAQVKQCRADVPCAWGVLSAARSITRYAYLPGGVSLDLALEVDVHRRQQDRRPHFHTSMAIPPDVPALSYQKNLLQTVSLPYGRVYTLEMDYGISYRLCAQRMTADGKPVDKCEIPFI